MTTGCWTSFMCLLAIVYPLQRNVYSSTLLVFWLVELWEFFFKYSLLEPSHFSVAEDLQLEDDLASISSAYGSEKAVCVQWKPLCDCVLSWTSETYYHLLWRNWVVSMSWSSQSPRDHWPSNWHCMCFVAGGLWVYYSIKCVRKSTLYHKIGFVLVITQL